MAGSSAASSSPHPARTRAKTARARRGQRSVRIMRFLLVHPPRWRAAAGRGRVQGPIERSGGESCQTRSPDGRLGRPDGEPGGCALSGLEASEAAFHSAFTDAPVAMAFLGTGAGEAMVVLRPNRALVELLGRPEAQLIGRPLDELVDDAGAGPSLTTAALGDAAGVSVRAAAPSRRWPPGLGPAAHQPARPCGRDLDRARSHRGHLGSHRRRAGPRAIRAPDRAPQPSPAPPPARRAASRRAAVVLRRSLRTDPSPPGGPVRAQRGDGPDRRGRQFRWPG